METLTVSLPKPMKSYVQERVAAGEYGNTSEYVRDLIRADQKQRTKEKLEAMLVEGMESGPATEMTAEDWATLRRRVLEPSRIKKKKQK